MLQNLKVILFLLLSGISFSQKTLSGVITDDAGLPIPFVDIYVKNNSELRTQSDENGKYSLQLYEAEYFIVFSSSVYEQREAYVAMLDKDQVRDIQLFEKVITLEAAEVTSKRINFGREYMLKVVEKREQMSPWSYPHKVEVYIKATETLKRPFKNTKEKETDDLEELERRKLRDLAGNLNMAEVQITRDYGSQNKVKETRNAFDIHGNITNLYYTTTVKSNFNFFQNLLYLSDLHQNPITSPISVPGIISYKYRLEKQYKENGRTIHKIKIIPRSSSTSTLGGYIYVIDSLWLIQKIDLTMEKGNLFVYDYFNIVQTFDHPGDSLCVLKDQILTYGVKYKNETSSCITQVNFSNYNFLPNFSPKYFSNEVASTSKEAYERDSSYWTGIRTVELTKEEKQNILVRDSIHDAMNRKEYLDSIDKVFNKITPLKVLWFGIEHRNRAQKTQWWLSSIAALARPLYIAGPRVAPSFSFFKKWEDQRFIDSETEVSIGVVNKDIKGRTRLRHLYNPFKLGYLTGAIDHDFDVIVQADAITQIYKRSNFIERTSLSVSHSYEYANGFYADIDFGFSERRSLGNLKTLQIFDDVIPNDSFSIFKGYQALIGTITFSYTPFQKYMREPFRKVVLGSKWPTFYFSYERGVPKLFGSDVDHEYALLGVFQNFQLGTLGTTSYHLKSGKFLSTRNLYDADFKFQRRSDPIFFGNPLYSFQAQKQSLPTKDYYFEAHIVHHDNSAIINKIPYMKKTGIGMVAGAGYLYVHEFNFHHYEILGGIERSFKISRRRLRLGIYVAASYGTGIQKPIFTPKFSFNLLNPRDMKYNF